VNRTDRLYAIVEELRAAGDRGRTATWLAERFEVSTRTVKRDVAALQQAGTPIWATAGPGGGYGIDAGATLPPLTFTAGEAAAIATALAAQPGQPFGADGRSALTKVLGAMTPAGKASASEIAQRVWVRVPDDAATPMVTRAVEHALRDGLVVVLDYVDATGRRSEKRTVEPMAVALEEGVWYLYAWCRRRRAGRTFRLDRIVAAWPTAEPVVPRSIEDVFGLPPDDAAPITW
jgi:predicted DNA-binding transcriptional regulator YafY